MPKEVVGTVLASGDTNPGTPGESAGGTHTTAPLTPTRHRLYLLTVALTAGLDAGETVDVTGWGLTWTRVAQALGTPSGFGMDVFSAYGNAIPGPVSWVYASPSGAAAGIWSITEWENVGEDGVRQGAGGAGNDIWLEQLESAESMVVGFFHTGNTAIAGNVGAGYNSLLVHNPSDFTGSLSIEYLIGGMPIPPFPATPPTQTPAYVGPGGARADWGVNPASRAVAAIELTVGGEPPWLRQRQRDDASRSRAPVKNAPTSLQAGNRASHRNRYS